MATKDDYAAVIMQADPTLSESVARWHADQILRGNQTLPGLIERLDPPPEDPNAPTPVERPNAEDAQGTAGVPGGATTEPEAPFDYRAEARVRFPWLSGTLLDLYVGFWADTGSAQTALTQLRQTSQYEAAFPGIRRPDGSLRINEQQYFATQAGFNEAFAEFGLNPANYRKRYESLFVNEVNPGELLSGLDDAFQRFAEPGGQVYDDLLDTYLDTFIDAGSRREALQAARDSGAYDKVFAGNRRDDGTLRMDEPDYFAYKRGWRRTVAGFGINPEPLESAGTFVKSVEAELSIEEVGGRLQATQDQIVDSLPAIRDFYAQGYGIELNNAAILASAIDPTVQRDLLERRITAAQIGGEAALQGFARSVERAERLARAGLDQSRARELYGAAGQAVPAFDALARRYHDPRGAFGIRGFEQAQIFNDADVRRRMQRRLADEESAFSSRADVRRERDGGLAGLRQR